MNLYRTLLFLPGNNPGMLQNGGVFDADGVILDLEDAVSPKEKDAARQLVANALRYVDYRTSKKVIRINSLDSGGEQDIALIVPCQPDALMLPKINNTNELAACIHLIEQAEIPGQRLVNVIPLIETPQGVANVYAIANYGARISAIAFGAEDYTAALGAIRTQKGMEILTARTLLVNAAAAAQIDAIDTPFTDVQDEHGLVEDTLFAKALGFKGKLAINPRQIDLIHEAFTPSGKEIQWAYRVVEAIEAAKAQGSGVIAVNGKMVDAPIVLRAERIIDLAKRLNLSEEATS